MVDLNRLPANSHMPIGDEPQIAQQPICALRHPLFGFVKNESSSLFRALVDVTHNALIRMANLAYFGSTGREVAGLAIDRKDWLLTAIAQTDGDGMTPIQIQKSMFLLKMEAAKHVGSNFYSFEPYDYGPFCATIYRDVEALESAGLVRRESGGSYSRVVATKAGQAAAKTIKPKMNDNGRKYLVSAVNWVTSVSFNQLLRSIYGKYPKYAVNSVFRR